MSTELATLNNLQVPDYARSTGHEEAALVTSINKNRISLRDTKFVVKEDGVDEKSFGLGKPIAVVILGVSPPEAKRTSKVYYEGAWTEGSAEAPDCYSNDGVRPDPSIADPQHDNCAQCPHNAWGSGTDANGDATKGKACSDRKVLIVALYGKEGVSDTVFELSVPPTSLKALSKYGQELVKAGAKMASLVTRISINEEESKQMAFSYFKFLDEVDGRKAIARAASEEIKQMVSPLTALPAPAQLEDDDDEPVVADEEFDEPVAESEPVPVASKRSEGAKKAAATRKANKEKAAKAADQVSEAPPGDGDMEELSAMLDELEGL